jgi:hypothetical protein
LRGIDIKIQIKIKTHPETIIPNTFYIAPVVDEHLHFENKSQHQVFDLSAIALAALHLFWCMAI